MVTAYQDKKAFLEQGMLATRVETHHGNAMHEGKPCECDLAATGQHFQGQSQQKLRWPGKSSQSSKVEKSTAINASEQSAAEPFEQNTVTVRHWGLWLTDCKASRRKTVARDAGHAGVP